MDLVDGGGRRGVYAGGLPVGSVGAGSDGGHVVVFVCLFVATGTPMILGDIRRVVAWGKNGTNVTGEVLGDPSDVITTSNDRESA